MDREEKARADAFNSRIDALKKSSARFENTAGAAIKQRQDDEYERTQAAVEKELRERERRERDKAEARRVDNLRSKEFNAGLMEFKRQQQEQELRERQAIRRADEEAAAAMKRSEQSKEELKRRRMAEFKTQLDDQVHQRDVANKRLVVLSPIEVQMNRALVNENPDLLSRALNKIGATPRTEGVAKTGFMFA